ncbi:MAG: 50S ribosomal protein L25 [bacterium]|nr:50S ribosomal protein L25 [bacterium]
METITLAASLRTPIGDTSRKLRREGRLPGIVYGRSVTPRPVVFSYIDFRRVYKSAGASTVIQLNVDGAETVPVLVQDVAYDPLTDQPTHVDFLHVNMEEVVHARIPLRFVGTAPAVKATGGLLMRQYEFLEVHATPDKLVHDILVDLTSLETLDDAITIAHLPIPEGVQVTLAPHTVIAKVVEVRRAAEEQQTEEQAAAAAAVPAVGAAATAPGSAAA